MNWKPLFFAISALGVVLILWGGIKYAVNQPLTSGGGMFSPVTDARNFAENTRRDGLRSTGTYIAIGGTCLVFVGIGGLVGIRKK